MVYRVGKSGNPKGRPKGVIDKRMNLTRTLQESGPQVVTKLIEMALAGDIQAIKLIVDRICPKPRADTINLGFQLNNAIDANVTRQVITEALGAAMQGELPEDQGRSIVTLVNALGDIDAKIDSDKRIGLIEDKLGIKG